MSDNNIDYTKLIGTLLKNNATVQEIAQVLGVTVATAQKYVDDYKNKQTPKTDIKDKLEPKRPQRRPSPQLWTRKKELRLYEMVQAGFSAQEIADELNVPVSLIRNKADKLKPTPQDDDDEPEQQQPTTPIKSKSRLAKTADKLKQGGQSVGRGTVRATKSVGRGTVRTTKAIGRVAWTATKAVGKTTGRAAGNLALNVTDEAFGNIGRLFTAPLRHRLNRGRHFARSFNPRESGVENYIDGYTDGRKDAVAATKNTKADNSQLAEKIGKLSETVKASGAKIDQRLLQTLDIIKRVNFQDSNTDFARGQEKRNSSGEEEKPSLFDRFFNSGLSNKTKIAAAGVGGLGILGSLAYFNWDKITGISGEEKNDPVAVPTEEGDEVTNPEELRRLEEAAENKTKEQAIRAEGQPDSSPPQQKLKIEGRELKYKAETIKFDADEIILKQKSGISGRAGDNNNNGGGGPNGDGGAGGQKGGMESVGADPPTGDAAERLNRRYNPRRGDSGGGAGTGGDRAAANAAKARDPMEQAKNILRREMPGNKFELPPDEGAGGKSGTESVGADPPTDSARDRLLRRYNPRRRGDRFGGGEGGLGDRAAEGAGIKDQMHSMDRNAADPNAPAANFGDRFDAVKANSKADKSFSTGMDKADGSGTPASGSAQEQALAEQRAKVMEYLDNNPALKEKLFAVAANEQGKHPQGVQAVMEETINRAIVRGGSVEGGIKRLEWETRFTSEGGYYEDSRGQGRAWGTIRNKDNRKIFEDAYEKVRAGGNVSKYAYGNASGGLAERRKSGASGISATPTEKINGETFFGPNSDEPKYIKRYQQWRQQIDSRAKEIESAKIQAAQDEKAAADKAAGVVNPNEVNELDKDEAYNQKLLKPDVSHMRIKNKESGWTTDGKILPTEPPPQVPAETIDKKDEEAKAIGKQSESKADETRQFASNDDTEKGVPTMEETTYNDGFTSGKFPGLSGHDSPFSLLA